MTGKKEETMISSYRKLYWHLTKRYLEGLRPIKHIMDDDKFGKIYDTMEQYVSSKLKSPLGRDIIDNIDDYIIVIQKKETEK